MQEKFRGQRLSPNDQLQLFSQVLESPDSSFSNLPISSSECFPANPFVPGGQDIDIAHIFDLNLTDQVHSPLRSQPLSIFQMAENVGVIQHMPTFHIGGKEEYLANDLFYLQHHAPLRVVYFMIPPQVHISLAMSLEEFEIINLLLNHPTDSQLMNLDNAAVRFEMKSHKTLKHI